MVDGLVWENGGACGVQGSFANPSDNSWTGSFGNSHTIAIGIITPTDGTLSTLHCRNSGVFWPTTNLPPIRLNIRLDGAALSASEISDLIEIASQCELLGGRAVNVARSILAAEGMLIWNDPDCGNSKAILDGGGNTHQPTKPSIQAECWPNPTNGIIHLSFDSESIEGTVWVFDASGKNLLANPFSAERNMPFDLATDGWSEGLLLVSVRLSDGTRFSWRVVLVR